MLAEDVLVLPDDAGPVDAGTSLFELVVQMWREPVLWEVATPGVENIREPHAALIGLDEGAACMTLAIVGVLSSGRRVFHAFERHHPPLVQYSVVRRFPEP